jgi:hypothetical protein
LGRDLPGTEHLSSVAMNVSDGGIAVGRDGRSVFIATAILATSFARRSTLSRTKPIRESPTIQFALRPLLGYSVRPVNLRAMSIERGDLSFGNDDREHVTDGGGHESVHFTRCGRPWILANAATAFVGDSSNKSRLRRKEGMLGR